MKLIDALIVSLAAGLSLSTVYLFASDYPGAGSQKAEVPALPCKGLVLHTADPSRACGTAQPPYHAIVGREVLRSPHWDAPRWIAHTHRSEVNEATLAIAIEPDVDPAVLLDFLTTLCREYGLASDRVVAHVEIDPKAGCALRTLDIPRLREALKQSAISPAVLVPR